MAQLLCYVYDDGYIHVTSIKFVLGSLWSSSFHITLHQTHEVV